MSLSNEGAQAPFFIPHIHKQVIPKQRFDSLLEQSIAAFRQGDYGLALLCVEIVCRTLPDNHYAALLRTRVVEQLFPSLGLRAGYLTWKRHPVNPFLQDFLLQQWREAGASQATASLAHLFSAQRFAERNAANIKPMLKELGAAFSLACWRHESDLVIEYEVFETHDYRNYLLCLSSEVAEVNYELLKAQHEIVVRGLQKNVAWSVSLRHKTEMRQFIASGSPIRLRENTAPLDINAATINEEILILIPVYQGYQQVVACISSVIKSLSENTCSARILVVDDAGNEAALSTWLQQLASDNRIDLIKNSINLGFIESVNRGILRSAGRHVLLLNSDTQVSGNWLDQMFASLQREKNIASVSTWSNNGEISSFPTIAKAVVAPNEQQLRELNQQIQQAANELALEDREVPVCCGFAMLMRAQAVRDVGLLDGYHLHRGYAEEVDWCLRATELGYKHVLNPRVFIAHHGGSSFKFEKFYRVAQNLGYIHTRYPGYRKAYQHFVTQDGMSNPRKQLIQYLSLQKNAWLQSAQTEENAKQHVSLPAAFTNPNDGGWIVVWHSSISSRTQALIRKISYALLSLPEPQPKLLIIGEAFETLWASGNCFVLPKEHNNENNLLDESQIIASLNIIFLLVNDKNQFPGDTRIKQLDDNFDIPRLLTELRELHERAVLTGD